MPSIAIKDEAEWLAFRDHHIGGSEVASLFYAWNLPDKTQTVFHMFEPIPAGSYCLGCIGPHKTGYRLFAEKMHRVMPEDLSENERVTAGKYLEPSIAAWSEHKFGWKLRKTRRYLTHQTIPGWGASLDYELQAEGWPPVEMKSVDFLVFRDEWIGEDDEDIVPPLHINLQVQAQIGVTSADHGWVVAAVAGNQLKRGRIAYHQPTQERIGDAILAFWRAIHANRWPTQYAEMDTVKELFAAGTKLERPIDLTADAALPQLCRSYLRWKRHREFVESVIDNLKGRIAGRLGDASSAITQGFKINWPAIHREEAMIPARLQTELDYRGGVTVRELSDKPRKRK